MTAGATLPDTNISAINAPSSYHMKSTYSFTFIVRLMHLIV